MTDQNREDWETRYNKDIDTLIEHNRQLRPMGMYFAFSGPAAIFGTIDPSLPYGVIRNGDGLLYDVLTPEERQQHPFPEGYHPGAVRALVEKD